jgi:hypothetical protein
MEKTIDRIWKGFKFGIYIDWVLGLLPFLFSVFQMTFKIKSYFGKGKKITFKLCV